MTGISCPKCPGILVRQTLAGVTVEKCSQCRGLFLDRGELEELLEAEHRWTRGFEGGYTGGRRRRTDDSDDDHDKDYQGERRKRQQSFLDEIFE
ncbi:zf-TFIIB domain-containing protein [Thermobifida cellulosilytica]|uniref:zf-TFIIB domain-containing protein n=1 Tax=Thermobifida cellulosilytica TaxID=144786 RepID=UPI000838C307|nr:zf-TFIIB domain-containing protein [Thermobifida cellulosilytica]